MEQLMPGVSWHARQHSKHFKTTASDDFPDKNRKWILFDIDDHREFMLREITD